jgi:ABC-type phosphate transport system substrate-binding protein
MNKRKFVTRLSGLICGLALATQVMAGDVVVIMAANAAPLTKEQVANVYLGRSLDFKPVDLPDASPTRTDFYKKATDRDSAQVKAAWARLMFTGHGQPPKIMADAAAVKKAVAADPKSVGYIDKADVDSTVKVVLTLN